MIYKQIFKYMILPLGFLAATMISVGYAEEPNETLSIPTEECQPFEVSDDCNTVGAIPAEPIQPVNPLLEPEEVLTEEDNFEPEGSTEEEDA